MNNRVHKPLLCAAAFAVGLAPGLSSCSKETGKGSTEQAGGAQEAASPGAQDTSSQSAQNAKALVKRMSDYLAAQQSIALSYDSIFEVVSRDHQKLQLATSGTVDLVRPDKLRTTRKSGFSDSEMVFDGKTLSILGKGQNAFVQAQAPGTVDQLIDQLRDKFHRQLPGADLLQSGVYDGLMADVTDVKDLGSGVIGGVECDHVAFRAKDTDWQIWIAQGKDPYPCRYVITSKTVAESPQFTMEIRDWKAGAQLASSDFTFKPPAGAKQMDVKDLASLRDSSDLPDNFKTGAAE